MLWRSAESPLPTGPIREGSGLSAVIGYGNVVAMIALGNADIYLIPVCVLDAVGHALLGGSNGQLLGYGITGQVRCV